MAFDKNIRLKVVFASPGGATNIRALPSTGSQALRQISGNTAGGRCTGQVIQTSEGIWLQITLYNGVYSEYHKTMTQVGYIMAQYATLSAQQMQEGSLTKQEVQAMINQAVSDMRRTASNLEIAAKKIKTLPENQRVFYQRQWDSLKANYDSTVQLFMHNNDLVKVQHSSSSISGTDAVGIIPIIIIVVVVIIAAASITYMATRPAYESSGINLKASDDLNEALRLLDQAHPGENRSADVKEDLEKQLDNAYEAGKDDGGGGIPWPYVIGAGVVLFFVSRFGQNVTRAAGERVVQYVRPKTEQVSGTRSRRPSVPPRSVSYRAAARVRGKKKKRR